MLKEYDWDKGRLISDLVIALFTASTLKAQRAEDRGEQSERNLRVAFALAAYSREHGKYPERLDALAPAYLPNLPPDLFRDGPLVYRPTERGYLLYSIGENERDDDGRELGEQPPGDDLRVQMPLRPLRK